MALINMEMANRGPVGTAGVVASGGALGGGASRFPRSCAASPSSSSVVIDGSGVADLDVDLGCSAPSVVLAVAVLVVLVVRWLGPLVRSGWLVPQVVLVLFLVPGWAGSGRVVVCNWNSGSLAQSSCFSMACLAVVVVQVVWELFRLQLVPLW